MLLITVVFINVGMSTRQVHIRKRVAGPRKGDIPGIGILGPIGSRHVRVSSRSNHCDILIRGGNSLGFAYINCRSGAIGITKGRVLGMMLGSTIVRLGRMAVASGIGSGIVPRPASVRVGNGCFRLGAHIPIPGRVFGSRHHLMLRPSVCSIALGGHLLVHPIMFSKSACGAARGQVCSCSVSGSPLRSCVHIGAASSHGKSVVTCRSSVCVRCLRRSCHTSIRLTVRGCEGVVCHSSFSVTHKAIGPLHFLRCGFSTFDLASRGCLPGPIVRLQSAGNRMGLAFLMNGTSLSSGGPRGRIRLGQLGRRLHDVRVGPSTSLGDFRVAKITSPSNSCRAGLHLTGLHASGTLKHVLTRLSPRAHGLLRIGSSTSITS